MLDTTNPVVGELLSRLPDPERSFVLSVGLECRPEVRSAFETLFVVATAPTRAEEGCWQYQLARDVEHDGRYLLSEGWRDLAALDAHFKTPHGRSLLTDLAPLLAAPFTMSVLAPVEV